MSCSTPVAVSPTLEFKQDGRKADGHLSRHVSATQTITGTVKGDKVEFTFGNEPRRPPTRERCEGDKKMTGTVEYGQLGKGTFTARRIEALQSRDR